MLHIPEKINDQVQDNFLLEHNAEWQTTYRQQTEQNRTDWQTQMLRRMRWEST